MQASSSQRLKQAASAAISAGNAVNVGTPYGDARAVRLESLLKLADLKAGSHTLPVNLHYCDVLSASGMQFVQHADAASSYSHVQCLVSSFGSVVSLHISGMSCPFGNTRSSWPQPILRFSHTGQREERCLCMQAAAVQATPQSHSATPPPGNIPKPAPGAPLAATVPPRMRSLLDFAAWLLATEIHSSNSIRGGGETSPRKAAERQQHGPQGPGYLAEDMPALPEAVRRTQVSVCKSISLM